MQEQGHRLVMRRPNDPHEATALYLDGMRLRNAKRVDFVPEGYRRDSDGIPVLAQSPSEVTIVLAGACIVECFGPLPSSDLGKLRERLGDWTSERERAMVETVRVVADCEVPITTMGVGPYGNKVCRYFSTDELALLVIACGGTPPGGAP